MTCKGGQPSENKKRERETGKETGLQLTRRIWNIHMASLLWVEDAKEQSLERRKTCERSQERTKKKKRRNPKEIILRSNPLIAVVVVLLLVIRAESLLSFYSIKMGGGRHSSNFPGFPPRRGPLKPWLSVPSSEEKEVFPEPRLDCPLRPLSTVVGLLLHDPILSTPELRGRRMNFLAKLRRKTEGKLKGKEFGFSIVDSKRR